MSRLRLVLAPAVLTIVACIDSPRFSTTAEDVAPATPDVHDGMIAIAETTLESGGSTSPTTKDEKPGNEGKKGGKGGGGGGGGGGGTETDAGGGGGAVGGGSASDAAPPEIVVVPAFWIDAREVSAAEYASCVAAGQCRAPAASPGCSAADGADDHPAACVTREQARAFCMYRGKRLVRDVEWTAAASGAARRPYPWGDAPPDASRLDACGAECAAHGMYATSDGYARTAPRAAFPQGATPEGVLDMAGNVAEWVDAPSATVRGGSWADVDVAAVRADAARAVAEDAVDPTIGFRCAAD